jgi:Zn-dependent protease
MRKQIAISLVSFALSVLLWVAFTGSIKLSLAFFLLLTVHEMGHYFAARQLGWNVTLPLFTPIGAFISGGDIFSKTATQEAYMAICGPLYGTIAALLCYAYGLFTHDTICLQAALIGFFLNLFNLIPFSPMDGGRIMMAVERRVCIFVGIPAIFAFLYYFAGSNPINLLIVLFIIQAGWQDIVARRQMAQERPEYFAVGWQTRVAVLGVYLLLAVFLFVTMRISAFQLTSLMQ